MPIDLLVLILLMGVLFWLLIIRPQSKRRREFADIQSELEPGLKVLLAGPGLYGTIVRIDDQNLDVEIAPNVVVTVMRQGVARIIRAETDTDTESSD